MNDPRAYYAGYAPDPYYYPAAPMGIQPMAPLPAATNTRFLKGAVVGALAAYLLSNPEVQQAGIKGAVRTWSLLQGGVEEMKERFRDAEAELHAAGAQEGE
jgi:hypothetical protein